MDDDAVSKTESRDALSLSEGPKYGCSITGCFEAMVLVYCVGNFELPEVWRVRCNNGPSVSGCATRLGHHEWHAHRHLVLLSRDGVPYSRRIAPPSARMIQASSSCSAAATQRPARRVHHVTRLSAGASGTNAVPVYRNHQVFRAILKRPVFPSAMFCWRLGRRPLW